MAVPFKNGKFSEDVDINVSIPAGQSIDKSSILEYYPSVPDFDEDSALEHMLQMMPQVEGQNEISPLMKTALSQLIRDVANHSYREGAATGFELGFWDCSELLGHIIDSDDVENLMSEMRNYAFDTCFGGTDIDNGWYACKSILYKLDMKDVIEFAQKHWMSAKESITWLGKVHTLAVVHTNVSRNAKVYEPDVMFAELLELFDLFRLEHSLGITYFHDSLDLLCAPTKLSSEYVEECKYLMSLSTLDLYRSGVPLEDIFA